MIQGVPKLNYYHISWSFLFYLALLQVRKTKRLESSKLSVEDIAVSRRLELWNVTIHNNDVIASQSTNVHKFSYNAFKEI